MKALIQHRGDEVGSKARSEAKAKAKAKIDRAAADRDCSHGNQHGRMR
jgi:hypothetical protein